MIGNLSKWNNPWTFLVKTMVSLCLILYLLSKVEWDRMYHISKTISPHFLFFAFIIMLTGVLISAYKWKILLISQGIDIPLYKLNSFYYIGFFFNNFLPTSIGGDMVRIFCVYQQTKKGTGSLAAVTMERLTGFLALLSIGSFAVLVDYQMGRHLKIHYLIFVSFFSFILIVMSGWLMPSMGGLLKNLNLSKIVNILEKVYRALSIYRTHRSALALSIIISFVFQCLRIIEVYLCFLSLNIHVSLVYLLLIIPVVTVITLLPISINGLGLREGAFVYYFSQIGLTTETALSVAILSRLLLVVVSIIGGITYILYGGKEQLLPVEVKEDASVRTYYT